VVVISGSTAAKCGAKQGDGAARGESEFSIGVAAEERITAGGARGRGVESGARSDCGWRRWQFGGNNMGGRSRNHVQALGCVAGWPQAGSNQ
jgi:hypothetical protein